ncbi:MAG: hypothetical protein ACJ790_08960, partial [Myxococcaceae bacterium]
GAVGTSGVGACHAGTQTCSSSGSSYSACINEQTPVTEICGNQIDDDCDGTVDDGCPLCTPNSTATCYTGPANTAGVGICQSGTKTCATDGLSYGPCLGEVKPRTELCTTTEDDNCDGTTNENCSGSFSYATDAQPIYSQHCGSCHGSSFPSGSASFAVDYTDSQNQSYYCPGKTKGACTLVRILEGSMPNGAGCTGDPSLDSSNPSCLTAAEQHTLSAWIAGGQLP